MAVLRLHDISHKGTEYIGLNPDIFIFEHIGKFFCEKVPNLASSNRIVFFFSKWLDQRLHEMYASN